MANRSKRRQLEGEMNHYFIVTPEMSEAILKDKTGRVVGYPGQFCSHCHHACNNDHHVKFPASEVCIYMPTAFYNKYVSRRLN
jgi:hypothetical protein